MAVAGPEFGLFARALARFSLGLNLDARRRVACWLFATLSRARPEPNELPGIVLWDEVEPDAARPRR